MYSVYNCSEEMVIGCGFLLVLGVGWMVVEVWVVVSCD